MDDGKVIWSKWQSLLTEFQPLFTRGGWVRFVQWVTGMALCDEEHTITQILTTLGLESRWRVSEAFAEYGAWDREAVERRLFQAIEASAPACWGGYGVVAVDDTKGHRRAPGVWGTSLLHQTSGRDRNRAKAVLAHNWVVLGRLVPGRPWTCLPAAARLYIRRNALPADETFLTKNQLAVAMLRQADRDARAPLLAVLDGAFARANVLRPCLNPAPGERRIDFVTRPRHDARLYKPPVIKQKKASCGGRPRQWGQRLASPKDHARWNVPWQRGRAYIYGRMRSFPRPTGLGPMGGHRQGPSGACLCLRGGRLPQTVVPDLQREAFVLRRSWRPGRRGSAKRTASATKNSVWAWRSAARGPKSRSCERSRCNWLPRRCCA